jgi:hypothetical protein
MPCLAESNAEFACDDSVVDRLSMALALAAQGDLFRKSRLTSSSCLHPDGHPGMDGESLLC